MTSQQSLSDQLASKKVAIYIRVSTAYQVDKDSLTVQNRELTAYADMVLGIKDYVVFEDAGYSAKNTDRPEYQEMMSRLRTGEFTHLLVWKIDRISRNLLDFSAMYQELKKLGVVFVSKNEQFDTSNAIGEAMLKIILVFAELERNMTSERVAAVMVSRANNGQWNGGRVPFGYDYDKENKTFSPNPQESEVVRMIYDLYEQYQSLLFVCTYLNDRNIKSRRGYSWTPTTVHKILTNPFYKGAYRYNVNIGTSGTNKRNEVDWVVTEEHHEPIVSDILFDRTQFVLKRNRRGGVPVNSTYIRKHIHIFGGKLKCAKCGGNMSATLDKRRADGWRPSLYGCSNRRNNSKTCNNKYVTDVLVGPFVFNYIANIIRAKESIKKSTSLEVLERKLLRGNTFLEVDHINKSALKQLHSVLLSGGSHYEFSAPIETDENSQKSEKSKLLDQKRKIEAALSRLHSLYLYSEDSYPENDYITERRILTEELRIVDEKLSIISDDEFTDANEEFIRKSSYFLMVEKLLSDRYVDYEKYIRYIDPIIPRSFIASVIDRIEVDNGKVSSITFLNGTTHTFEYKTKKLI